MGLEKAVLVMSNETAIRTLAVGEKAQVAI
jgi:hypothetical protein